MALKLFPAQKFIDLTRLSQMYGKNLRECIDVLISSSSGPIINRMPTFALNAWQIRRLVAIDVIQHKKHKNNSPFLG